VVDGPITSETLRVSKAQTTLRAKKMELLAQAMSLLVVYHELVLLPQGIGEIPISIRITISSDEF
jgi:hypothetical protein